MLWLQRSLSQLANKTCCSLRRSLMRRGKTDGRCYLSRLLLLLPLFLLRLHQTLLCAQQLFVQNISLVFCLRTNTHRGPSFNTKATICSMPPFLHNHHKHIKCWQSRSNEMHRTSACLQSQFYRFTHTPHCPGGLVYCLVKCLQLSLSA